MDAIDLVTFRFSLRWDYVECVSNCMHASTILQTVNDTNVLLAVMQKLWFWIDCKRQIIASRKLHYAWFFY